MFEHPIPRRGFVRSAVAVAGAAVAGCAPAASSPAPSPVTPASAAPSPAVPSPSAPSLAGDGVPLRLGVASYSLRQFPRDRAIAMIRALGTPWVNVKSFHLPYDLTPDALAAARREFEDAGLRIVGGGTITFERDDDDHVRRWFAYARGAGMPLIVATAAPALLPRIERFAREYDVKVAIHNHGPEDPHYPSPYDALRRVERMDARMGLCVDVGHTVRAGTDVVRALADAGPRVLDLHVKDLRVLTERDSQVAVGEGRIPIAAIFRQLVAMRYDGYANLEYEIAPDDPLPGMQRSFAHMRGILAGLGVAGA